jgi:hypothetical protein
MARRNMGKNEKLTRKEKQELRKDGEKMREQMRSIVLPTIGELLNPGNFKEFLKYYNNQFKKISGVVVGLIIVYVFLKTRSYPNIADDFSGDAGYN